MSYLFNQGYKSEISSKALNDKIHYLYGANGVLKGFELENDALNIIIKNETVSDKIGIALVHGTVVAYYLVDNENYANITIPNTDGKYYIYGEYQYYQKAFKLFYTTDVTEAQGSWKVFLGHAVVSGGVITELKGLSEPIIEETDAKYKRIPSITEAFAYLYNTTIAITGDIAEIVNQAVTNLQEQIDNLKIEIDNIQKKFLEKIDIDNLAKKLDTGTYSLNCFQVSKFENNTTETSRLLIKLPVSDFSGEVISIEIQGIEKSTGKTFNLLLGGTLDSTDKIWKNVSANIQGDCNFPSVTFGRSSDANIGIYISIGGNDTIWDHVSLIIKHVLVSNISVPDMNDAVRKVWRDNWKIGIYDYVTVPNTTSYTTSKIKTGGPQEGEFVHPYRQVIAGTGLTGGGKLHSDITLSVNFGTSATTVARGNHNHDDKYVTLNNPSSDAYNKIAVYSMSGRLIFYDGFNYGKLDVLKNVNSDLMTLLNGKAPSGHNHDGKYLSLSGGTVSGNLSVTGTSTIKGLTLQGRNVVLQSGTPTTKTDKMIWIKCR